MKKQKDKNKFLNSGFFIFKNAVKINKIELIFKALEDYILKSKYKKKYSNIKNRTLHENIIFFQYVKKK